MRMYDLILKKRNGEKLSEEEIRFFIKGYTNGDISDYHASALMMAIYFQGMDDEETVILTDAMAHSGDTIDLSRFGDLSVDKHSTGGVGDKTSLIVGPIIASCGGKLAKMTGRGLGHTGGTVDKLESIPGFNISLTAEEFSSQTEKINIAIIGQTGNLAPADKKLYALRDVTATVDSIPLITSSIMSKKLAAGAHNIVLDVKVGSGAFMKTPEDAEALANKMVAIGKMSGRNMAALITNMDSPLGSAVGNQLEIIEAVSVLKNEVNNDLREVSVALAGNMIALLRDITPDEGMKIADETLTSGKAFEKMKEWIKAQGGDISFIEDTSKFTDSKYHAEVYADKCGFITSMNAEQIGITGVILGAGRSNKEDSIDYTAGIIISKKVNEKVSEGELLATLYTNNEAALKEACDRYKAAIEIGNSQSDKKPLIYKTVR